MGRPRQRSVRPNRCRAFRLPVAPLRRLQPMTQPLQPRARPWVARSLGFAPAYRFFAASQHWLFRWPLPLPSAPDLRCGYGVWRPVSAMSQRSPSWRPTHGVAWLSRPLPSCHYLQASKAFRKLLFGQSDELASFPSGPSRLPYRNSPPKNTMIIRAGQAQGKPGLCRHLHPSPATRNALRRSKWWIEWR